MGVKQAAKWIGGLVAAGTLLLVASIFVADRRLAPPFEEAELGAIEIPVGIPIAEEALLFAGDQAGNLELYARVTPDGEAAQLTSDPDFDSWRPRLSPDRSTIAFYRTPAGVQDTDLTQASLWMVSAQGGPPVEVLPPRSHGWTRHGGAEWSPMGDELVMMGERPQGYQIWVTTIDGRAVRSLVSDPGDNTDPSWDPGGERVLYIACPESPCAATEREIFSVQTSGGDRTQLTSDELVDEQPRFSPDGSHIAMRSQIIAGDDEGNGAVWDIRVVPTSRVRLPERLVGDASISDGLVWLDEQTVAFHRTEPGRDDADIVSMRISASEVSIVIGSQANEIYPD